MPAVLKNKIKKITPNEVSRKELILNGCRFGK